MTQPNSFGEWLRRRRRALDWTQEELARQAGCAIGTIRKLEADERRPSKQLAEILAQRLDIPPHEREEFVRFARDVSGDGIPALPFVEETASFAPTRLAKSTHNLPTSLTSFIGREREMAEVKRLLATTRLLTLVGTGGCGKTRLALQAAAGLLDAGQFPDGIWFVELAPLADPNLVMHSIAAALGLRERAGATFEMILHDYLGSKNLLIILDNCEHLITACAKFSDTCLHACPHVKILASSREALGIAGETTFRVPSLEIPTPKHVLSGTEGIQLSIADLAKYDSIRLFTDRAAMVQPSFAVTLHNASAITQICNRLDGIPLAIELAAMQIRGMTPEQIVQHLDDRFRLLTGGSRTALPRQQTLRATMDWSHSLLLASERKLLRRLSVFVGGWTLEAAEAVCSGDGIETNEVLEVLLHLVDKSLVVVEAEADSQAARYRMLETVRQYAREKLLDSGESEQVRDRHLSFYLKLAEEAEPKLIGAEQVTWFNRMDGEHDNIRTALDWSSSEGRVEKGLRLGGALFRFWLTRGYWSEGYQRLDGLLKKGAEKRTLGRGKALMVAGSLATGMGASEVARRLCEESISILRELEAEGRPWLESALGRFGFFLLDSDLATARACAEETARLSRESGNIPDLAQAFLVLGGVARWRGDFSASLRYLEETKSLYQSIGDRRGVTAALVNLGWTCLVQGDLEKAQELVEQTLAMAREVGNRYHLASGLRLFGMICEIQGQGDEAEALLHQGISESRDIGNRAGAAEALMHLGRLHLKQGQYAQAQQDFRELLVLLKESNALYYIPNALDSFAFLYTVTSHAQRAAQLLGAAEALRGKFGTPLWLGYRKDYETYLAVTRSQLDDASFNAAWEKGRAMTMEQAIEYALAE